MKHASTALLALSLTTALSACVTTEEPPKPAPEPLTVDMGKTTTPTETRHHMFQIPRDRAAYDDVAFRAERLAKSFSTRKGFEDASKSLKKDGSDLDNKLQRWRVARNPDEVASAEKEAEVLVVPLALLVEGLTRLEDKARPAADKEAALVMVYDAAMKGSKAAIACTGAMVGAGVMPETGKKTAFDALVKYAEAGDPSFQALLGLSYWLGNLGHTDIPKGTVWLEKAASGGHMDSMFLLGASYARGKYVGADEKLAKKWLEMAKNAGHPEAKTLLRAMSLGH